jgi:hypothetical protein
MSFGRGMVANAGVSSLIAVDPARGDLRLTRAMAVGEHIGIRNENLLAGSDIHECVFKCLA